MVRSLPQILLVLLASILSEPRALRADELVRIGVAAPLTGESAVFGEDIVRVLQFARDHYKDEHVHFDVQDDTCSGTGGVTAAHYFIQRKVRAVIGFACVEAIIPAISALEEAGITTISVLASSPEIVKTGSRVFNLYPDDGRGIRVLLERFAKLGIRKPLVLTAESAFPEAISKALRGATVGSGVQATYVNYPSGETDFVPLLLAKASGRKFEGVFVNYSSASELRAFLQQRNRLKLEVPTFAAYLNGLEEIRSQGHIHLLEGIEFYDTAPNEVTLDSTDLKIFDEFVRKYGHLQSSDGYFPFIFNGYTALRRAMGEKELSKALRGLTFVDGVGPDFSFDEDGAVRGGVPFVLKKIVHGDVRVVE